MKKSFGRQDDLNYTSLAPTCQEPHCQKAGACLTNDANVSATQKQPARSSLTSQHPAHNLLQHPSKMFARIEQHLNQKQSHTLCSFTLQCAALFQFALRVST